MKNQMSNNRIVMCDLITSLSQRDRSTTQKINKELSELKQTSEQFDLVDVFKAVHLTSSE